jgi:putative ABC transport system substrate-binding protein
MNKKISCLALSAMLFALSGSTEAQQPKKVPRIGIVGGSQDANNPRSGSNVIRQELRDLGYVEGKNILIELRSAEGKNERFPILVGELVQLNVDVIVCTGGILAAKKATKQFQLSS